MLQTRKDFLNGSTYKVRGPWQDSEVIYNNISKGTLKRIILYSNTNNLNKGSCVVFNF